MSQTVSATKRLTDQADIGKALDSMTKTQGYAILYAEIIERIKNCLEKTMSVVNDSDNAMLQIGEYRGLQNILDWIEDEKNDGANAIKKLRGNREAEGQATPQEG